MSGQISLIEKKMEKKWKFIFNSIFIIQNTNFQFQQLLIITIKGSYKKENDVCFINVMSKCNKQREASKHLVSEYIIVKNLFYLAIHFLQIVMDTK
jgi:hypothetical protein